jgi:Coenzyme PQQ synthesis protein D (PqqD)
VNHESTISRSDGWLAAPIGEELMMMSADSSAYLSLAGSGGRIWELLEKPRTLAGLCEALAAEYKVQPSEIRDEVLVFLEGLHLQHAIQLHPSALA